MPFLFPRRAMEKIYKGYFLDQLRNYIANGTLSYAGQAALENILDTVGGKKWNVHGKGINQRLSTFWLFNRF